MFGVEHRHQDDAIKKEVEIAARLFLGNQKGGYLILSPTNTSRYDGFFIFNQKERQMYKILESLNLPFSSITNSFTSVETDSVRYTLMPETDSVIAEPNSAVDVILDVRRSYDLRVWGRYYSLSDEGNKIIVRFEKKTDSKEDSSHEAPEFEMYVVIRHNGRHELKGEWIKRNYQYDLDRGSGPGEREVYNAARVEAGKIVISASRVREQAEKEAERLFRKKSYGEIEFEQPSGNKEVDFAYNCALASLDNLTVEKGILAGFPWFFQYWTRDESVTLGSLISLGRHGEAKAMLFSMLDHIMDDGRITNQLPTGGIGSADSNGWCFLRLLQLEEQDELTKVEKTFLLAKAEYLMAKFNPRFIREGLIYNGPKETWMDTDVDGQDTREGARIEIQAFQLAFYKLLHQLSGKSEFLDMLNALKDKVRQKFWNGTMLADGLDDFTIRPNIFLAYYAFPEILTSEEWKKCFDSALEKLWLDWGGLSTIDKGNRLFSPWHTGENNRSYHRGDSWYWINNLAALSMHRLDKDKYSYQIKKILDASTSEILWSGAIGSHAEVSSASRMESKGCLSQAWSIGTYIELVNEMYQTTK